MTALMLLFTDRRAYLDHRRLSQRDPRDRRQPGPGDSWSTAMLLVFLLVALLVIAAAR